MGTATHPAIPEDAVRRTGPPDLLSDVFRMLVGPSCNGITNTTFTAHAAPLRVNKILIVGTFAAVTNAHLARTITGRGVIVPPDI